MGLKQRRGRGRGGQEKNFSPLASPPLLPQSFPWLFKMAAAISVPLSFR